MKGICGALLCVTVAVVASGWHPVLAKARAGLSPTCTATSTTAGQPVTVAGSGFNPNTSYTVDTYMGSAWVAAQFATAGKGGTWSAWDNAPSVAGSYTVNVLDRRSQALLATCGYTIT